MGAAQVANIEYAYYERLFAGAMHTATGALEKSCGFLIRAKVDGEINWRYTEMPLTLFTSEQREKIKTEIEKIFSDWEEQKKYILTWPASLQFAWDSLAQSGDPEKNMPCAFNVNALIGADFTSATELSARVRKLIAQGYSTIKIKVDGENWRFIVGMLSALDASDDCKFYLDANGIFSLAEAERVLSGIAIAGANRIVYCEDPISSVDIKEWEGLQSKSGISLAIDTIIRDFSALEHVIKESPSLALVIKPSLLGHWDSLLLLLGEELRQGRKITLTSALETEIGLRNIVCFAQKLLPIGAILGISTIDLFQQKYFSLAPQMNKLPAVAEGWADWISSLDWREAK